MEGYIHSIDLRMPAKINLWLEVLRKRPDGYHDLSSLMLPIGLYDDLTIHVTKRRGIQLTCDHPDVPADQRNLAWRAAAAFLEQAGIQEGLEIELNKSIPVGAGLGGGSSDAAGVLLALDACMPGLVATSTLHKMARGLGADVPFFLYRRPALATGIGDQLEWIEGIPNYPLVCIKPPIQISTADVYGRLRLTENRVPTKVDGLKGRPWNLLGLLVNDLERVTIDVCPRLGEIKEWLRVQSALGVLMSGSGPTIFAVFHHGESARSVAKLAQETFPDCWVVATEVLGAPDDVI